MAALTLLDTGQRCRFKSRSLSWCHQKRLNAAASVRSYRIAVLSVAVNSGSSTNSSRSICLTHGAREHPCSRLGAKGSAMKQLKPYLLDQFNTSEEVPSLARDLCEKFLVS